MRREHFIDEATDEDGTPLGVVDREAMHELLADLEAGLFLLGGVAHIAARRVQTGEIDGRPLYSTTGYLVVYDSYVPAADAPAPKDAPAPAPEPEYADELDVEGLAAAVEIAGETLGPDGEDEELDEIDLADRAAGLT